jgi:hypothetical protein
MSEYAADLARAVFRLGYRRATPRILPMAVGSVMLLGHRPGNSVAADALEAIEAIGGVLGEPVTRDEIEQAIALDLETRGLREEAGYTPGPPLMQLRHYVEVLPTGRRIGWWLMLMGAGPDGDAVYWQVSAFGSDCVLWCASVNMREQIMDMLRYAATSRKDTQ